LTVIQLVAGLACEPRNAVPYLIALALSANIGSAATIIGNPQNMLIGAASGITFLRFLSRLWVPSALGTAIAYAAVVVVFRSEFVGGQRLGSADGAGGVRRGDRRQEEESPRENPTGRCSTRALRRSE
jgi:Na+/H+ antiporter NhaD/arsenite permease-like protein